MIDPDGASLPVGTVVSSHFVLFDPRPQERAIGYIDFDYDILAIIRTRPLLRASNFLGDPTGNYDASGAWALEDPDIAAFNITNPHRLQLNLLAAGPGDRLRVLTGFSPAVTPTDVASTPEPGTLTLLGIGLLGMVSYHRYRRR